MTTCFYHDDMDGKCSAAIVAKAHPGQRVNFIPADYHVPINTGTISDGADVFFVDFSPQEEVFQELLRRNCRITWIDHHVTALQRLAGYAALPGNRDDSMAACLLTWRYFFPGLTPPETVKLLADYDTWTYEFGDRTRQFQAGIRLENTDPDSSNWEFWLNHHHNLDHLLRQGEVALRQQRQVEHSLLERYGFVAEFAGHTILACNAGQVSSSLFEWAEDYADYPLCAAFVFTGKLWKVTLYTARPDIHVGEIAAQIPGGGGHRGAAGFHCEQLPFKFIRKWRVETAAHIRVPGI